MRYTSRGIRRRGEGNQWEVILSHKDPLTGEVVPTYHTITAKTKKAAEKARDELIVEMEIKGGAVSSSVTVQQFMDSFLAYKEASGTIEPSTIRGYRAESKQICSVLGSERLCDLTIPAVNSCASMRGLTLGCGRHQIIQVIQYQIFNNVMPYDVRCS